MIKSRRLTESETKICAKCQHLRYSSPSYYCQIDGENVPDNGCICLTVCDKFKEVNKDGRI